MLKRILSVMFVFSLIFSVASCAGGDEKNNNDSVNDPTQNIDDVPKIEETSVDINTLVPQRDLEGFEMRFITDIVWDWDFGPMHYEVAEEITSEPVNDAFYIRNSIIEERLNIKITENVRMNNDAHATIKKLISSGSDEYDVVISQSWSVGPITADGNFVNLNEVPGLQLDQSWWDQHSIRDYSIKDHLYFMTGDYNLINNDATWVLFFNKVIARDLGLEMPYQSVLDGRWTYEKMMEYQKAAAWDMNGDGEYTADDRWGMVTHTQHYSGILIAGGESLITRDAGGLPVYGQITDRFNNVYQKIIELMQSPGYTMNIYLNIKGLPSDKHATKNFLNNEALFCPEILAHTRRFREMENDFGILPHPKYNENQKEYNSYVLGQVTVTCIPVTNTNLEKTAIVLDALGMMSTHTIIPAYYDVSLIGKFFRDDESADMIDIIRANRVYDIGAAYAWGDVTGTYEQAAIKATAIASVVEKNGAKINAAIQKTLTKFGF